MPYTFSLPAVIVLSFFLLAIWSLFVISFRQADKFGVIQQGVTLGQYIKFVRDPFYFSYLYRSLHVSLFSTLAVLLIGYPFAFFLSRSKESVRRILTIILLVNFLSSYVMRMYAIMLVIGNNGVINRTLQYLNLIDHPIQLMYGEFGVGTGLTAGALVFMVFCISSVLDQIDRRYEEAATSLGASRYRVFVEVTLPLSIPGIASGIIIVFLFNLCAFVTPALLGGGRFEMVSNFVYEQSMELLNFPFAACGAFVLLVISLFAVFVINRSTEKMVRGTQRS